MIRRGIARSPVGNGCFGSGSCLSLLWRQRQIGNWLGLRKSHSNEVWRYFVSGFRLRESNPVPRRSINIFGIYLVVSLIHSMTLSKTLVTSLCMLTWTSLCMLTWKKTSGLSLMIKNRWVRYRWQPSTDRSFELVPLCTCAWACTTRCVNVYKQHCERWRSRCVNVRKQNCEWWWSRKSI